MAIVEPKSALQKIDLWRRCRIFPASCRLFASLYIMSRIPLKRCCETSCPQPFYQPRAEVLTERGTSERICRDLPEKSWRFYSLRFRLIQLFSTFFMQRVAAHFAIQFKQKLIFLINVHGSITEGYPCRIQITPQHNSLKTRTTPKWATAFRYLYKFSTFLRHKVIRALLNCTVMVIITLKTF